MAPGRRETFLATVKSLAKSVGAEPRNPKWTSYGALELDIFAPSRADLDLFLSVISPLSRVEFYRNLNEPFPHSPEEKLFADSKFYFNSERYWECHEVLESVWRNKMGPEKRFLQGLILVCAAFVHHQKGEQAVALSVLRRASPQLDFAQAEYHGFDVGALRSDVGRILQTKKFVNFRV
jgi:hypothetical protein